MGNDEPFDVLSTIDSNYAESFSRPMPEGLTEVGSQLFDDHESENLTETLVDALQDIVPLYAALPGHDPQVVERATAVITKAKLASSASAGVLADFFYNDDMRAYVETYAIGEAPFGVAITANGDIVFANGDRNSFYTLREEAGNIRVYHVSDPINLVDPEAECVNLGLYSSPSHALRVVCAEQGLDWPGNDGPKP